MNLVESALIKIEGLYPSIKNTHVWEIRQLEGSTGYSKLIRKLYPRDIVASIIQVAHNAEGNSLVSIQDVKLYNELIPIFNDAPVIFVRNLPIRQWFVVDSVSTSKTIDEDLGVETWSYDFNLLDPVSILKHIPLANNQIVSLPSNPPDDFQLPANYLKFALGTGTEIKESLILSAMIDHTLVNGSYLHPTIPAQNGNFRFRGLRPSVVLSPSNPVYASPKTSWINTECGDVSTLEKIADMGYECPIIGVMDGDFPVYQVWDCPNLNVLSGSVSNRSMASYTAGFEHSNNQAIIGITETFPALLVRRYTGTLKTPYKKMAITESDMPEGTSLATATDQLTSLVEARLTKNDIKRFIDTQLTTQLKPWENFILGDAIQINIDDVQGFGVINLMVTEISEAIEDDAIIYTLTLEELEDSYASL